MTRKNDKFDLMANTVVEEHMRVNECFVPHPDYLKNAIAMELRHLWNAAVYDCIEKAKTVLAA